VTVRALRAPPPNTSRLKGENRPFLPTEPARTAGARPHAADPRAGRLRGVACTWRARGRSFGDAGDTGARGRAGLQLGELAGA
jgi:hypothetical protein